MFPIFLGNVCVGAVSFLNNCSVSFITSGSDNRSTLISASLLNIFLPKYQILVLDTV